MKKGAEAPFGLMRDAPHFISRCGSHSDMLGQ